MRTKKALTLIEILVVMILIGVIAGLVVPGYRGLRERSINREAQAMLALIRSSNMHAEAEGGVGNMANCAANNGCINGALRLDLPAAGVFNWTYSVTPDAATPGDFCAEAVATATNPPARNWCINRGLWQAVAGGCGGAC